MKAGFLFALASLALIAAAGWLLGLAFPSEAERRAIWLSAAVAYGVQLLSFAVARLAAPRNLMAGWGLGSLMRLATLAVAALVLVPALGLPATAALISLATFFFVSIVIEPVMLSL